MNFNLVEMYNGLCAFKGSLAKSGSFDSRFVRSNSSTSVGFFTTVKLD